VAALLAAGPAGSSRAGSESGIVVWVGALLLAAPVLAVLVPLVELIWVAMSFALAPILGALIATTLLLVLPALDGLAHPNRWWAPVTGLVLAAGFAATGIVRAGAEPDRPAPSTLLYVLDRDEGTSRWASAPDGGLAWARQSTGTELADEGDLSAFRRGGAWFMSVAPAVDAPPPEATVRSDTTLEGRRHVVVALDAPLGAEGLTFTLPEASPWTFVAVNGHPVPPTPGAGAESAGTRILDHWGVPADTLTLGLEAPAGVALPRFWIVEQMLRPGALVGDERFQRPDTLVANAGRGSDRALIRTPVRLAPEGPEPLRTDSTTAPVPDTGTVRPPPDTTGAADTTGLSERSGSAPTARRTPHPMR
jgi:hypothetical protein